MKIKHVFLVLLGLPVWAHAQLHNRSELHSTNGYIQLKQSEAREAIADFSLSERISGDVLDANTIQAFIKQNYPEVQGADTELKLFYQKQSRLGWHYTFSQTYKGIPVYKANITLSVNADGVILSSFNLLVSTQQWESASFVVDEAMGQPIWIVSDNKPIAAYQKVDGAIIKITDEYGTTIATKDGAYHYEDTMVTGKVFLPDPLTSQGVIYGQDDTYKHFNDSDYALLNDQRKPVVFPATDSAGVFILENKYVKMLDISAPWKAPVTSTTPNFEYNRSEDGFKETMVMYHLYATQMYYQYLGFNELKDYQIKVDAHASTSDNSSFNFPTDSSLTFGTGGVPDAEDGDVSCHEYTHALSWFIKPSPDMNSERRAIEEAICDVIAANLSKRNTEFNWRYVYNFDAPIPVAPGVAKFWSGRNGNSPKTYQDYSGSPYTDAEIWLSTMLDIAEAIGNDTTAILMLSSVYSMSENTTMPQAAILFMQADSVLMNKSFGWKIGPIFNARKLGNFPTAIDEQQRVLKTLVIQNSAGFMTGDGAANIQLPFKATITVHDIQGKKILEQQNCSEMLFHPDTFVKGLYIITINTGEVQMSLKLIR